MTKKADIAIELYQAYKAGRITAESALLQNILRNLKPSQQRVYALVSTYPGITSMSIARRCDWSDSMAATTLKDLYNMGIINRRKAWANNEQGTRFFRYYVSST